ncbi:Ig domain protein group 2 domain protein [Clostridium sp. DL-VIII]|uniref:leucine-rich repeat protein n=1 Tax=Clostridium sp. DL-VIII TaxID=641107 RepID=UPI00023B0724|nr:leucine-rich repeat protein [Clostridium sp. DL-VIII]EHJ02117.1 Ig domain protein group 2 domain protein [Clostridium sp. DL-VIII]
MLKIIERQVGKLLFFSICISLLPSTVAFSQEKTTNDTRINTIVQTTGPAVSINKEKTVTESLNNELVNSGVTNEAKFTFDSSTGTITGFYGSDQVVVIPSTINGVTVKKIGENAFFSCDNLTSVTIPSSVTSIGSSAFSSCNYLVNVSIPNSVKSIGGCAFEYCTRLASITIPDSVTSIGSSVFYECSSLKSVKFPSGLTSIGDCVFYNCSSLDDITIPDNVTSIGNDAFLSCTKLTSIHLPVSLDHIGKNAFINCSGLKSVVIPKNVTGIEDYAFYDCTSLKSITIPDSVTSIGQHAFYDCENAYFYVDSEKMENMLITKCYVDDRRIMFNQKITTLTLNTYSLNLRKGNKSSLKVSIIPCYATNQELEWKSSNSNIVTVDGNGNLDAVGVGKVQVTCRATDGSNVSATCNIVVINNQSVINFDADTGTIIGYDPGPYTEAVIPSTIDGVKVTTIGDKAFADCNTLTSITLPDTIKSINDYAFSGCTALTSINLPKNLIKIGDYALESCYKLKSIIIPNGVTSIGNHAFASCGTLTQVTIPNSVTSMGDYAFSEDGGLTKVSMPSSINRIGRSTFLRCYKLTSITIPNGVTSIGEYAFEFCENLQGIIIPESVTSIEGEYAFRGISNNAILYIENEDVKELLINYGIDKNSIKSVQKVTEVTLDTNSLTLEKGKTSSLIAIIYPDSTTNKTVIWETSDSGVATVDDDGEITGIGVGSAIITCTASDGSGKYATCVVNVTPAVVKVISVALNTNSLNWTVGKTGTFTATILPRNANNQSVTWKSSNTKVATVSSSGKLTAVGVGSATITCTASDGSGKYATCKVTVTKPTKVTSVKLNTNNLNWTVGKTGTFTATVGPSNASNKGVTWKSSNTKVATVSSSGKLTAVGVGSATITCTASDGSGKYATCKVTVTKPTKVTSVKLNTNNLNWTVGKTGTFTATVGPSNASNKGVTWKSSNIKVATVSSSGKLTAVGVGSATITCTASDGSGKYATCKVTVTKPTKVTSVKLNTNNLNWTVGKTGTFTATVGPSNASNKGVTWKSSNTKVATVSSSGKLTAVGVGSATITCTASDGSGKYATCKVIVTK